MVFVAFPNLAAMVVARRAVGVKVASHRTVKMEDEYASDTEAKAGAASSISSCDPKALLSANSCYKDPRKGSWGGTFGDQGRDTSLAFNPFTLTSADGLGNCAATCSARSDCKGFVHQWSKTLSGGKFECSIYNELKSFRPEDIWRSPEQEWFRAYEKKNYGM